MMFFKLVLGVMALAWCCLAARRSSMRVYKGDIDSFQEFPFAVLIQLREEPYMRLCTGTLVAQNWVLTAAHCFSYAEPYQMVVKYGEFTVPANRTTMYARIVKELAYESRTYRLHNNIGLAIVEKIQKPTVKLLALDYRTLFGLPVKYAGFGRDTLDDIMTGPGGEQLKIIVPKRPNRPLQVGEGIVVPCGVSNKTVNEALVICVAPKCSKRKQAFRIGDAGAPLLFDGRLAGVAKGGSYDHMAFTPISLYLQWIRKTMAANEDVVRNIMVNIRIG